MLRIDRVRKTDKDKIIKNLRKNIKEDRIRSLSEQHIREK